MALIACKECGENVSTKAKACPHCGNPVKKGTFFRDCFIALLTIIIFFSIIVALRPDVPLLDLATKEAAIDNIKQFSEIIDAAITQKGKELSLVLVVPANTSIKKAKKLGDHFVRLVKSSSKDTPGTEKKIGKSIYRYLVRVYTPQKEEIVLGTKAQIEEDITW